jgi:uncharacterized protein (TIGR02246 family)
MKSIPSKDIAAIKKIYKDWKKYWENGDAKGVVSFYTDDVVQIPIGEPNYIIGKKALKSSLETFFKKVTIKGNSPKIHEVEIIGDMAFLWGTYKNKVTPKNGDKPIKYSGKFLHIFKRQKDRDWKIYRAIGGDDSSTSLKEER